MNTREERTPATTPQVIRMERKMTFNTDRLMREAAQAALPGIVQKVDDIWHLEQEVKQWTMAAQGTDRQNMNQKIKAGKALIRLKAQCKAENKPFEDSLKRLYVSSQRASEMMRAAELDPDVLLKCSSWGDVERTLGECECGKSPPRGDELARKKTAKTREPGDEGDEPTEKILSWTKAVEERAGRELVLIAKIKQVDEHEAKHAGAMVSQALNGVRGLANRAYRPVPPPQERKCPKCNGAVLLVTSRKGKRFYVEGPGRGRFKMEGGLAVFVRPEQREGKEWELHRLRCIPTNQLRSRPKEIT